ncbi:MAG: ABC transporter permease [Anaerolineae bacterium]|nr:ABC transporter permease [Anaerolineae bacterium]
MTVLIRTLGVETLKLKRTLAFWLALVAPLSIVVLQVGMLYERGAINAPGEGSAWIWYCQLVMVFWALLMLPLFVTLETALTGQLEHAGDHWKHLYALPVPRGSIYAAKQFSGMFLIGVSTLALPVFTALGGLFLRWARPGIGLDGAVPWELLLTYSAAVYASSWLVISIQTWISLRWKSFVVACTVGILLTVAGTFVINADWGQFWPWAVPGVIGNHLSEGIIDLPQLIFGSLGGIAAALLAGWDVCRRDVL